MGQRLKSRPAASIERISDGGDPVVFSLALFSTDLGWFGLLGAAGKTCGLRIGHVSADEVRRSFAAGFAEDTREIKFDEYDWNPELRQRLRKYTQGARDDFRDVELQLPRLTDFQRRILNATRGIDYGATLSYGEVAAKAGSPRAARAVGNAMAANRISILIPCHRVVASGQKIGGFSAPQGIDLKKRMLALEADG